MSDLKLRECPFCGCDKELFWHPVEQHIKCHLCGAIGPPSPKKLDAISLWNDREPEHQDPRDMGWVGSDGLP